MNCEKLAAPFPYFGGKSGIAPTIWTALGDVDIFIEPFIGSAAVLLARPHTPRREIANDRDGFVANFWRSVQKDPAAVAAACRGPAHELELLARHRWLCDYARKRKLIDRISADVDYCDPRIAGYWAWIMSVWIGSGVCEGTWFGPDDPRNVGTCIVNPKKLHLAPSGVFAMRRRGRLPELFGRLAERLAGVIINCGDWSRCFIPSDLAGPRTLGVYLDPPYAFSVGRTEKIYRCEKSDTADVGEWCRQHGTKRHIRIVLSGFEGEYNLPGWRILPWKKRRGYARAATGLANCDRERLWISPHCGEVAGAVIATGRRKTARWRPRTDQPTIKRPSRRPPCRRPGKRSLVRRA